jgi:ABC-type dipeptide/oligopeptide/nickel transport system ATPase subunit
MTISTLYDIGEILYIVHDIECMERMCTSIKIMPNKLIVYELSLGTSTSWHFEFEVSRDVDICRKLNIK